MNAMATYTAQGALAVGRTIERQMLALMATQAHVIHLFGRGEIRSEYLRLRTSALDVRVFGPMTARARDTFPVPRQRRRRMRVSNVDLYDR